MSKWNDDGWRVASWMWIALVCVLFGCAIYWAAQSKTPDMPFSAWLASASRDDVWLYAFSCVASGVGVARAVVRSSSRP